MEGDSLACLRVRLVGIIVVYNPQDRRVSKDPWSSNCRRCDTENFPPQIQRLSCRVGGRDRAFLLGGWVREGGWLGRLSGQLREPVDGVPAGLGPHEDGQGAR